MSYEPEQCQRQMDELLNLPQQSWLLGAGVSKDEGIPLMLPLTNRVQEMLKGEQKKLYQAVRGELTEDSHVEHVLSHIGDLVAIATRTKFGKATLAGERTLTELKTLHAAIQACIRDTMRWGFIPEQDGVPARTGTFTHPIIQVDNHVKFAEALFKVRRANLDRRPPVALFTINYDTLLEDALALCRIRVADGFSGGAMAFWEPGRSTDAYKDPFSSPGEFQAKVYKLHGSIDWYRSDEDIVVRRRDGAGYPPDDPGRLLLYPQANKYQVAQKDPFASLFATFRSALNDANAGLLAICGYSFSDEHINQEIEEALKRRGSNLTVLVFAKQPDLDPLPDEGGLPPIIVQWLQSKEEWNQRVVVAGSRGVYHGGLDAQCLTKKESPHTWWSFDGVTQLLQNGPEVTA